MSSQVFCSSQCIFRTSVLCLSATDSVVMTSALLQCLNTAALRSVPSHFARCGASLPVCDTGHRNNLCGFKHAGHRNMLPPKITFSLPFPRAESRISFPIPLFSSTHDRIPGTLHFAASSSTNHQAPACASTCKMCLSMVQEQNLVLHSHSCQLAPRSSANMARCCWGTRLVAKQRHAV